MVEQSELSDEQSHRRDALASEVLSDDATGLDADVGNNVWAMLTPRERDFIAVMLGRFQGIRGAAVHEVFATKKREDQEAAGES